ncbi:TetR/AcrR family transcriptional regulator [Erwinia sp. BNK-24-b]|uniref:TetR/AcrR family transcriptional regulator n=1 Tax=Erwinia TaxID=551 RepID=UPI001FF00A01|nr:TetR/AcrR family transcriptional regulator [Erwinia phyllosphaerae]MBV4367977.1 TetR/AcrR family transcriptional regulator [Erwinia phyllosphaerae]
MMKETAARGRPAKSMALIRKTVFSAAIDIIEVKGVSAVSIDEIARQSRLAKKTIYKYFDSKDMLINEMIVAWTSTRTLPELHKASSKEDVLNKLRLFFIALGSRVLSRESVAIYKYLQNEKADKREKLAVYRSGGIVNASSMLNRWLEEARSAGWINPSWPQNGAAYLQALIVTPLLRDISLGITPAPTESEMGLIIDRVLTDFRPLLL